MGLSDLHAAAGGESAKKPMAVEVKVEPLDCKHAAADAMKAIEAKDVNAFEDAMRRFFVAVDDDGDGGDGDGKKEEAEDAE